MVKNADGSPMKKDDFRIIREVRDLIINSPYAYLSDLPDDMKTAIKKAFLDAPQKDPEAFEKLSDGKKKAVGAVDQRGLGQDDRADQIRRQPAQEESS